MSKRYVCYRCGRIFQSEKERTKATCPFCKAVPCKGCGKMPQEINNVKRSMV